MKTITCLVEKPFIIPFIIINLIYLALIGCDFHNEIQGTYVIIEINDHLGSHIDPNENAIGFYKDARASLPFNDGTHAKCTYTIAKYEIIDDGIVKIESKYCKDYNNIYRYKIKGDTIFLESSNINMVCVNLDY